MLSHHPARLLLVLMLLLPPRTARRAQRVRSPSQPGPLLQTPACWQWEARRRRCQGSAFVQWRHQQQEQQQEQQQQQQQEEGPQMQALQKQRRRPARRALEVWTSRKPQKWLSRLLHSQAGLHPLEP